MTSQNGSAVATLRRAAAQQVATEHSVEIPDYDRDRLEDVGFMTAMTLVLLGNYAQTGHFGGRWRIRRTTWRCTWAARRTGRCGTTTDGRSTRTATDSCWRAGTTSRRRTRCG